MEEVQDLPLSNANLGGGEEATSTSAEDDGGKSGGYVGAEREEDGGATAKVSKLNLIRSLFVCLIVCLFVCFLSSLNCHWVPKRIILSSF